MKLSGKTCLTFEFECLSHLGSCTLRAPAGTVPCEDVGGGHFLGPLGEQWGGRVHTSLQVGVFASSSVPWASGATRWLSGRGRGALGGR